MKENSPQIWTDKLPSVEKDTHKYKRGHAVIYGGPKLTGAARLAAEACMRMGAGLCTVACSPAIAPVYRTTLPAHIMVEEIKGEFLGHLGDQRRNAVLIGPGAGQDVKQSMLSALSLRKPCVLDADALTCFKDNPQQLYDALHDNCLIVPHEGEFEKVFPDIEGKKEDRAAKAAKLTGANVLLKGAETVIVSASGEKVLNTHSSPYLATAGAGDVLAGMITGLIAQRLSLFDAACIATWIHGEAGLRFGPGLVASDIPNMIPDILEMLYNK